MAISVVAIKRGSGPKPALICGTPVCAGKESPVDPKRGAAVLENGSFLNYACAGCYGTYQANQALTQEQSNG